MARTRKTSSAPRRQRKALYTADSFHRRQRMSVPLSRELRARFHCRSIPVRKGDTVRILSGSYVGSEERVARVDRRSYTVVLNNITLKTGEQKQKPLPIRTGQLLLTKLNLSDAWRRRVLAVAEEELSPEELGTTPTAEPTAASTPAGSTPSAPKGEDEMQLTEAEREFVADAIAEDDEPSTEGTSKAPVAPSSKTPAPTASTQGDMKLTPKETAFFESAEREEYGPNAKAVRTHQKAPKTEEEDAIGGEPAPKAKPASKPRAKAPPKEEDDA